MAAEMGVPHAGGPSAALPEATPHQLSNTELHNIHKWIRELNNCNTRENALLELW